MAIDVVFAGGGTGGHLYPALALAARLREMHPDSRILFIGTQRLEAAKVPAAGFSIRFITVRGLAGAKNLLGLLRKIQSAALLVFGIPLWQSLFILRDFRPQVVVGTGGYVCGPVILAARLLKIPTITVEQNLLPGFTTCQLARLVDIAALPTQESVAVYPKPQGLFVRPGKPKLVVTGNPVRADLLRATKAEGLAAFNLEKERKTLLVFGGSLGSPIINRTFLEALEILADEHWFRSGVQILHITGAPRAGAEEKWELGERARRARLRYQALPYLDNFPFALAAADLALCRGGGTTIAELVALGLPAIIIPWEGAANNEQYHNARPLAQAGAALVMREDELTSGRLASEIKNLLQNPAQLQEMAQASRKLGHPEAADAVIALMQELVVSPKVSPAQ
jgi:UDP-N-acetylglucosamine--N-acetylmuramyl-(pentapeptide) pyrophosphoryl-undecaprenol N-acetylglucosamine transferase